MQDSEGWWLLTMARRLRAYLLEASRLERFLLSLGAFFASLVVGALFVVGAGLVVDEGEPVLSAGGLALHYNPIEVYAVMFQGAVGSLFNLSQTLGETTILVFTGAAVAIAFRGGLFNIGVQGQMVLGALATTVTVLLLAPVIPVGRFWNVVLVGLGMLAGLVIGAGYAAVPGALKAYADANEVITTILLNYIATAIAIVLVKAFLKPPDTANVMTDAIPARARLEPMVFPENASFSLLALVGGILLVVGLYYFINHSTFGYEIRVRGIQSTAADFARVDDRSVTVWTMVVSGAIAGLAGALYVLMVLNRWRTGFPSVGFDGIAVSVLAGNSPAGLFPAAGLFGLLKSGSLAIDANLGIPRQFAGVLRGLIILFVAMPELLRQFARHEYSQRLIDGLERVKR